MTDPDERARAHGVNLSLEWADNVAVRAQAWLDTGAEPYRQQVHELLDAIGNYRAALREERRRVWEEAARECERRLEGCNTKGRWSQKVTELVYLKEWCRHQAEAPHG